MLQFTLFPCLRHLITLPPCHLDTSSPCHLVTPPPCHPVTLSPCHPITSSLISPLLHITPHLDTLSPCLHPRLCLCPHLILTLSLSSPLSLSLSCPCLVLILASPYTPEYSLSWTLYSYFSGPRSLDFYLGPHVSPVLFLSSPSSL